MEPSARFWAKVEKTPACWLWRGAGVSSTVGYGLFRASGAPGGRVQAHRYAYELTMGPIPAGLEIDHLCRNRACVNPAHLEAVTPAENVRRERLHRPKRTACLRGHPYDAANTRLDRSDGRTARVCRICSNAATEAYRERRAASASVTL